ncbi:Bax inhibitor-1/YccA family protein [Victivallis sp. Marseille-Q1083]|uniref:Bax inhibitor-1/YccA family protein n=1 Tax=Victivallis sp. Marseille-Q1083 TaxID=2717288 RepID=UPI00158E6563|nr:Bax inhibitor-1/YccA family protein [Victivallis sp. Marseille-Q1083]
MLNNSYERNPDRYGSYAATSPQISFLNQVYGWMCLGLLLTAGISGWMAATPGLVEKLMMQRGLFWGLLIGELLLVIWLSAGIGRMSSTTATVAFLGYAALNGVVLSGIFLVYTQASLFSTFLATAATFGGMSFYGYTTKRDLSSIGSLCIMALWGVIIGSIINLFWANNMLYWLVTYLGIAVFVGLTAYDTQKIRELAMNISDSDSSLVRKLAILGALRLYLDFINLFLLLLRIFGNRR